MTKKSFVHTLLYVAFCAVIAPLGFVLAMWLDHVLSLRPDEKMYQVVCIITIAGLAIGLMSRREF